MKRFWTFAELLVLWFYYPNTPTRVIAGWLGRSLSSVYGKVHLMGLSKSEEFLKNATHIGFQPGSQIGRKYQFKKGHRPHNTGKKGWQAGGNSSKTRFKKGNRPHTWLPVGSHRFSKEGILQRKISDTGHPPQDWKSVHSLLWEKHNGPVPPGHIVVFKNRDRSDIRIENLELITRAENMRRNTIHNLPDDLADVIRLRGRLNRQINKRMKNEKQD